MRLILLYIFINFKKLFYLIKFICIFKYFKTNIFLDQDSFILINNKYLFLELLF